MVRQLGIKGSVPATPRRTLKRRTGERKRAANPDAVCFWAVGDISPYEDTDALEGLI